MRGWGAGSESGFLFVSLDATPKPQSAPNMFGDSGFSREHEAAVQRSQTGHRLGALGNASLDYRQRRSFYLLPLSELVTKKPKSGASRSFPPTEAMGRNPQNMIFALNREIINFDLWQSDAVVLPGTSTVI
jgi:hypothetical protein